MALATKLSSVRRDVPRGRGPVEAARRTGPLPVSAERCSMPSASLTYVDDAALTMPRPEGPGLAEGRSCGRSARSTRRHRAAGRRRGGGPSARRVAPHARQRRTQAQGPRPGHDIAHRAARGAGRYGSLEAPFKGAAEPTRHRRRRARSRRCRRAAFPRCSRRARAASRPIKGRVLRSRASK